MKVNIPRNVGGLPYLVWEIFEFSPCRPFIFIDLFTINNNIILLLSYIILYNIITINNNIIILARQGAFGGFSLSVHESYPAD